MFSEAYVEHLSQGAFPHQIDPFAEAGRYFQQIHSGMIAQILEQIRLPLLRLGYMAGRETSLQIAEYRQPDVYIEHQVKPTERKTWNYPQAAEAVLAEPGTLLANAAPELEGVHLKEMDTGRLVTVVELISPRNKTEMLMMQDYQERRTRLMSREVNVVEIDLTRSVKRLVQDTLAESYAYHVAVFLHDQAPRLIGMEFGEALKRCALPLREEVVPVELQAAYEHAYQQASIAGHIQTEVGYADDALPFPTLLSEAQRQSVRERVQMWQQKLTSLRSVR